MADAKNRTRYFYQGDRLQAVQSEEHSVSFFRGAQRPLVQRDPSVEQGGLLLCDEQSSVLLIAGAIDERIGYSPYGYTSRLPSPDGGLAFNGEFFDPVIKAYLLGSYRLYDPALMRFYAPDSESPFRGGGMNTYGYCMGDPVNASDPTGHWSWNRVKFARRYSSTVSNGVPSHGIPGKYSRPDSDDTPVMQILAPTLTGEGVPGVLPEIVRSSIHLTQHNLIRERQFKEAFAFFRAFDKGDIDKDQLWRHVGSMLRVNASVEMKKEESIKRGYFFSFTPYRTAESRTALTVENIRGVHN